VNIPLDILQRCQASSGYLVEFNEIQRDGPRAIVKRSLDHRPYMASRLPIEYPGQVDRGSDLLSFYRDLKHRVHLPFRIWLVAHG